MLRRIGLFLWKLNNLYSEDEDDEGEEVNEEDMVAVENSGEKRNKKETAEEKRLRKQKVKEMKSVCTSL